MTYPLSVMNRAKELTAAGFTPTDVGRIIHREMGHRVSRFTVRRWTDEAVAEAKRAEDRDRNCRRRAAARGGRLGSDRHSVILQERRVVGLVAHGAPVSAVANVMTFDYPDAGWTVGRVARLTGATPVPVPAKPAKTLDRLAVLERAAELRRKGWTWSFVAEAMAEYHGQPLQEPAYWRHAVKAAGLDVPKRELSPARVAQLERLHEMQRLAVAA